MEKIGTKKYKTLYPDSMISTTKVPYRQTIKNLNSFLNNNFSKNSSLTYKFPIKKHNHPSTIERASIRRSSPIIKERPNISPEKSTIKTLKESLSKNYISYNYYDNTRGPLKSTKNRRVLKPKKKQKNTVNSVNETKANNNLLSFDSRPISPKSNMFNSSLSLYKITRKIKRNGSVIENNKNSNLNSFSFNKFKINRRNLSKNNSVVYSPSSTRYRSVGKKNSLKLEYDSISLNNSENKKISRNRSTISMKSQIKSKSKLKIKDETGDTCENLSNMQLDKEQRHFHQKLSLHQLLSQLNLFESKNGLQVDESKIKQNLLSPTAFQRDLFIKEMKRASNHNDFFFKKFPFQSEKFESLNSKQKKRPQSPHQNLCDNKSKYLLKNIDNLYKKLSTSHNYIKNINYRLRTNNLKRIIDYVVPTKNKIRDMDIQFKDETLNYQRNIGKFFIYKGSGIYSDHLSSILRGDKIVKQTIKFDSI